MEILKLTREELRFWFYNNHMREKEVFVLISRSKKNDKYLPYLDALEEALCFGWIDSTVFKSKEEVGACIQRFSPRTKKSIWTELNKARVERLIKMGLVTKEGLDVYKKAKDFYISEDILMALKSNEKAYNNFKKMPQLYQRVRIDTIQRYKKNLKQFVNRLKKFIDNCEKNIMFGQWNDDGKLT